MAITATLSAILTVLEELTVQSASGAVVTHTSFNQSLVLNAGSAAPATEVAGFRKTLSGGAGTIDLTSLTGTEGTVDGTGLKVQALLIVAVSTNNAAGVVLTPGASNGIDLRGSSWRETLLPGQWALYYLADKAPDIASGDRTIDLAGTGTDAVDVLVVMG